MKHWNDKNIKVNAYRQGILSGFTLGYNVKSECAQSSNDIQFKWTHDAGWEKFRNNEKRKVSNELYIQRACIADRL